jgi:hypothetical protein
VGIGVASRHQQWSPLINKLFAIANDHGLSPEQKQQRVESLIDVG